MSIYTQEKRLRLCFVLLYAILCIDIAYSSDLGSQELESSQKRSFSETTPSTDPQKSLVESSHKKQKRADVTAPSPTRLSSKERLNFEIFHKNDAHFYLPPLSTAMLKRIFDRPHLLEFFLRTLSDMPNLTKIKMTQPSPEENIPGKIPFYFMFEGLKKQKKVAIFLARNEVEFFSRPLYEYSGLGCEWFTKEEHKLPNNVRSQYNILIYIDLIDISWNKPFSRDYHLHISDDEKTAKELSLDSPTSADPSSQRAFYKPYFMDCMNRPAFPFLNEPEVRHFSLKENLLYTLRHAYLFSSMPPHLKEFPKFQELFDTLDARDWTIQEWIDHIRDIAEEDRRMNVGERLNDAWDFIEKLWPFGAAQPQNLDVDTLMFIQQRAVLDRYHRSLKDMAELLNTPRERLEPYLTSTSFPISELRREVCFRDKSGLLYQMIEDAQTVTIAKNLRMCLANSSNPKEVLKDMRRCESDPILPMEYDRIKKYGILKSVEKLLDRVMPQNNS